jgi:phage terminase large subunit-like protein
MTLSQIAQDMPQNTQSTLSGHDLRSGADWLACAAPETQAQFLASLSDHEAAALPWLFEFWAFDHQMPPEGDWRTWVIMGGRGAGKTRAGSEWVRAQVEGNLPMDEGRARRVALVGETFDQVRDIMVFGESGIIACSPPDRRPEWNAGRKRLEWQNGAIAEAHSASSPEGLRGPQFDAAWVDELAKWKKGDEAWDMLQFGLRLGEHPQQVVTTTPRNVDVLKRVLEISSTVTTTAPTEANRAYLADNFLAEVRARYGQTRQGRQELDGVLLADIEGALWTNATIERARKAERVEYDRVVVAVDPAVSSGKASDACGIVVVGAKTSGPPEAWEAVVLEDATVQGASPQAWAEAVVAAYERHDADRVVAEVNQGGDLVESLLASVSPLTPFSPVRATRGKVARAEPIAALYEQGRVAHVGGLGALEDQMCQMCSTGFRGKGSPDRVDALVWAITALMPGRGTAAAPRVRSV